MASPLTVGTTAIVAIPVNKRRASIRLQNTGSGTIYLKKIPMHGAYSTVTAIDYQVLLAPATSSGEAGEAFTTNSIASMQVIGSASGCLLSVYETNNV